MKSLTNSTECEALDRLLDPLNESFTPAFARRLVKFRANAATQARIEELAGKCNEGELSRNERREYESYVKAINLIAVLQSKARAALAKTPKS